MIDFFILTKIDLIASFFVILGMTLKDATIVDNNIFFSLLIKGLPSFFNFCFSLPFQRLEVGGSCLPRLISKLGF